MFHDGSYRVGMHGFCWLFGLLMIDLWFFSGLGRAGRRVDRPRETARQVLGRRLAGGEINPQPYEERKALLDRDAPNKD